MRKIIVSIMMMILGVTLTSYAQPRKDQKTPEQQATQTVERLNKDLKLTDQQKKQLQTYYLASFKKRQENMKKNKEDREAMREAMTAQREENDAQLQKVLTKDQYKKYKANEEAHRKEMQQKGGRGGRR